MAIEKPGALQSDINEHGYMVTKRERRDQSEGGRCALSKSCSAITVMELPWKQLHV
jgi:hypothetical protein